MKTSVTAKKRKTPISYYGGKQMMVNNIIPLIPEHTTYTESFFGGGAIYWAKEPSKVEVINDLNKQVINFYHQLKTNFKGLKARIECTLHSRDIYEDCKVIYKYPHLFNAEARAWAFWVLTNQGFASKIGSWGYGKISNVTEKKIYNKKVAFTEELTERLSLTQIESNDACKVIKSRDHEGAFHFVDPPYIGTDCGHYSNYSEQDYINLLDVLANVKGKFLLSSFHTDILDKYKRENGWYQASFEKQKAASKSGKARKVEVLTANYKI